jgi:hypothetical protein
MSALPDEPHAVELDDETLDSIDHAEDQIERGEVHDWEDVRDQVLEAFLRQ